MSLLRKLQLETLESRRLLAVDLLANVDIKEDANFIPRDISSFNGQIILRGNDGRTGPEAWVTDGTPESTRQLKDIRVGAFGSGARDFTEFQGRLFFAANNGFSGLELWVTDGTKATTQRLADIWPGTENGAPTEFTVFNDSLYFFANDGESGRELYRTDGTAVGTVRVADSVEGRSGSSGVDLMVIGDRMFFESESVVEEVSGLWVSDGTAEGTVSLAIPGLGTNIDLMTPFGDRLLFVSGEKLWVSDGTVAGSRPVVPTGSALGVDTTSIVINNDKVYVTDELGLHEIAKDLAEATTLVAKADGVATSAGKVYFWDAAGLYIAGNDQTTKLLGFNAFFGAKMGSTFNVDGGMLFNAKKTLNQHEIWVTDGTQEGTRKLESVTDDSSEPLADFQQIGDSILFTATNGNFYESVWSIPAPVIEVTNPGIPGDVNGDSVMDAQDIDALYAGLATSSTDSEMDVNEDGVVSSNDVDFLIENILDTKRGDLDLNGKVEFADFLQLSTSFGQTDSSWGNGDVDGDGEVAFADFLILSANFGFDSGNG